ncbi:TIGR01906 family membrane protein [Candidatus Woesearchaeota archaeon]|jgi:integral membrane protein (TIGR01906 family)|nr:TIGR01906 family membrane protein [Candidatus Woesearchaeota archaeon]MBT6519132.1 TIGR01906 family membrane protein [Candidatus Woesearchaeota archaeon]MBT7367765.1 TIGR01906 family membrane protein [Candidatus Woesearchaeota archaeon]
MFEKTWKKGFYYFIIFVLVILIPLIVMLGSGKYVMFDDKFYLESFENFGVYDYFSENGYSGSEINAVNSDLLDYFRSDLLIDDFESLNFFNAREKSHLVDVKNLVGALDCVLMLSVFLFLIFLGLLLYIYGIEGFKVLGWICLLGGLVVFLIVLLGFIGSTQFDNTFNEFHYLFFEGDSWLFDPVEDNIIKLYPFDFFFLSFVRIVKISMIFGVLVGILGLVFFRISSFW